VLDGAPLYSEEKSEVRAAAEFGTTAWLVESKPFGTYSISISGPLLRDLQCQGDINSYSTIVHRSGEGCYGQPVPRRSRELLVGIILRH
jgi:hypothetical protein